MRKLLSMQLLTKIKIKNTILAIIVSVVAIFVPSFIFNKWMEGIVFFFSHWFIREQFSKQYHSPTHALCRLVTSVVFFFGVSFVLPFGFSLFSAIPICYFISWVGFTKKQADYYELKYENLKRELEKKKEFNTDTCSLDELLARCNELHFSKDKTELAIEFFIYKTKQSELADKFCIEEKSIQQHKRRLRQKLNNK